MCCAIQSSVGNLALRLLVVDLHDVSPCMLPSDRHLNILATGRGEPYHVRVSESVHAPWFRAPARRHKRTSPTSSPPDAPCEHAGKAPAAPQDPRHCGAADSASRLSLAAHKCRQCARRDHTAARAAWDVRCRGETVMPEVEGSMHPALGNAVIRTQTRCFGVHVASSRSLRTHTSCRKVLHLADGPIGPYWPERDRS